MRVSISILQCSIFEEKYFNLSGRNVSKKSQVTLLQIRLSKGSPGLSSESE